MTNFYHKELPKKPEKKAHMNDTDKYAWFSSRYGKIFDWFALPEQKSHPVLSFKLHALLFIFSIAQLFILLFYGMGLLFISHPSMAWMPLLCLLVLWGSMLSLHYTEKMHLSSHGVIFSFGLYITWFCFMNNGFRESTFAWFIFLPIVAGVLLNLKASFVWSSVILVLNLIGHYLSAPDGLPNLIAPEAQNLWMVTQQTSLFICGAFLLFFLLRQQKISSDYLRERIISKQNMMRILVHDIANPLSTIHLSGQLLMSGGNDFPPTIAGERIQKNADRIMNIIQLIRDMEGWEGGKKSLQLTALSVSGVLDDVIAQLQNRLSSKSITLKTTYSQDEHVWGHPTMLCEQILGNLISNAIKFSPVGGTIDVSVEPTTKHEVTIVIRDYGIGIPHNLAKVLFDPLAQTSRIGTAGEKGTGFGLPITKNCVDLLGGRLQLHSRSRDEHKQDHGTRVVLVLRRADSNQSRKDNS